MLTCRAQSRQRVTCPTRMVHPHLSVLAQPEYLLEYLVSPNMLRYDYDPTREFRIPITDDGPVSGRGGQTCCIFNLWTNFEGEMYQSGSFHDGYEAGNCLCENQRGCGIIHNPSSLLIYYGAPGVTRTPGKRFRKPLLYPPELRGLFPDFRSLTPTR